MASFVELHHHDNEGHVTKKHIPVSVASQDWLRVHPSFSPIFVSSKRHQHKQKLEKKNQEIFFQMPFYDRHERLIGYTVVAQSVLAS